MTFQYNINGEIRYARGGNRYKTWLKIYFGELARVGRCTLKPEDLKIVKDPHRTNKVFDELRHI